MSTQATTVRNNGWPRHDCCTDAATLGGKREKEKDARVVDCCSRIELAVGGMTCQGCVARIETAMSEMPGVARVAADLTSGTVAIDYDPEIVLPDRFRSVILSEGYRVAQPQEGTSSLQEQRFRMKPYQYGLATMVGAAAFYLGLITLTSDWYNAKMQFSDYRWWLAALAVGLGIQVTLYTTLRRYLGGRGLQAANTSVAASGGMSTAAMAVCCSHYLATFLPLIGLPFLSAAAAGLESYQVEFFAAGVVFNIIGVGLMVRLLKMNRISVVSALR